MWQYEKKLQFPVNIRKPDARAAKVIISQLGGLEFERYFKIPVLFIFNFNHVFWFIKCNFVNKKM